MTQQNLIWNATDSGKCVVVHITRCAQQIEILLIVKFLFIVHRCHFPAFFSETDAERKLFKSFSLCLSQQRCADTELCVVTHQLLLVFSHQVMHFTSWKKHYTELAEMFKKEKNLRSFSVSLNLWMTPQQLKTWNSQAVSRLLGQRWSIFIIIIIKKLKKRKENRRKMSSYLLFNTEDDAMKWMLSTRVWKELVVYRLNAHKLQL